MWFWCLVFLPHKKGQHYNFTGEIFIMLSHGSLWVSSEASYAMVGDVTIAKKGENNSCLAPGGSIHEGSSLVHVKSFSKPTSTSVQGVVHVQFSVFRFQRVFKEFSKSKSCEHLLQSTVGKCRAGILFRRTWNRSTSVCTDTLVGVCNSPPGQKNYD